MKARSKSPGMWDKLEIATALPQICCVPEASALVLRRRLACARQSSRATDQFDLGSGDAHGNERDGEWLWNVAMT